MPTSWVCVKLPASLSYEKGVGALFGEFLRQFFATGSSAEMGLFKSRRPDADGGTTLYLTPAAAERCRQAVDSFGGKACAAPLRAQVALVAGHMSARDLLAS